jgi:predicted XRE-type DNA-binding protein
MVIEHVTSPEGNIFEDLGFDADEAADLKTRSRLMATVKHVIREREISQTEAAELFGVTKDRIGDLMNGRIDEFPTASLLSMLDHAQVQWKE